jgi:hypothetical protein
VRRRKERDQVEREWRREGDRKEHWWDRQHYGRNRNWECKEQGNQDSLMNTDRKKRRILLVT